MSFGERLNFLRKEKGLTKTKLAENLGLTRQLITKYEGGKTIPSISFFALIADYFHVSADYLLGRSNDSTPPKSTEKSKNRHIDLPAGLSDENCVSVKGFADFLYSRQPKT